MQTNTPAPAPVSGLAPMHPGELLREDVLPEIGKGKAEIAKLLGISRQALNNILSERAAVTPAMALRLGKLCGNGPTLWLNLQNRWDMEAARAELGADLDKIPTLVEAVAA